LVGAVQALHLFAVALAVALRSLQCIDRLPALRQFARKSSKFVCEIAIVRTQLGGFGVGAPGLIRCRDRGIWLSPVQPCEQSFQFPPLVLQLALRCDPENEEQSDACSRADQNKNDLHRRFSYRLVEKSPRTPNICQLPEGRPR
jgi:hypothetical protein